MLFSFFLSWWWLQLIRLSPAGQFPFTEATMRCDLYKKYVEGGFAWPAHFNPDLVELCSGDSHISLIDAAGCQTCQLSA